MEASTDRSLEFRGEKLNRYRKQGLFTDITFLVDGTEFQAHKVILCCQSDVFEAMFLTSGMQEALSGQVEITDVSKEEFEGFLHFLYTGALPSIPPVGLAQLVHCSEKYGVTELTSAIQVVLYDHCVMNNKLYFDFLPIADMYNLNGLKEAAIRTITRAGNNFTDLSLWYKLASSHFHVAEEIIKEFIPNNLTVTWNITPSHWHLDGPGQKPSISYPLSLRNNGHALSLFTTFSCERRTLQCVLILAKRIDYPYCSAELRFEFVVKSSDVVIHSGGGNVWWEVLDGPVKPQVLFECLFKSPLPSVKNQNFSVEMTFSQWGPNTEDCEPFIAEGGLSKVYSTPRYSSPENVPVRVGGEEFIVDKIKFLRESSFFRNLFAQEDKSHVIGDCDKTVFSKIHAYISTGLLPQTEQVDSYLLAAAKEFDLRELAEYCESAFIRKLNTENVMDSLIVASQNNYEELERRALRFINFHHKQISDDSWSRLEYHPYLVVAIVKTLVSPSSDN